MGNILKVIFVVMTVAIGGGAVFLPTWDIPAPSKNVETVIDDSKFPS